MPGLPQVFTMKKSCLICGTTFTIDHPRRSYCSHECRKKQFQIWDKARAPTERKKQIIKSWNKKKEILQGLGGRCAGCGITDLRVLEFSHLESTNKHPRLKKREKLFSMTKWRIMEEEIELGRVILECANCHRIRTHNEIWDKDKILTTEV